MNSKKVNRIFLAIILIHIVVVVLLGMVSPFFTLSIVPNFIFSQIIVLAPALIGVALSGENLIKLSGFRKIKISSVLMIILFTFLAMPLTTVINAISMLFVDNTVAAISGDILGVPFFVMLFIIGILGPFSEELIFRGIIYQGYKKSGTTFMSLLLSACLFSLMHMNFNQAAYALVIGMILALLVEATGSLWSSILFHIIFNSQQVCLMYLYDIMGGGSLEEMQTGFTTDMMVMAISAYLIIAAVTTTLAGCVLAWIAKNEKREENLRAVWADRKNKTGNPMVTVPLLVAIVLALFYMSLDFVI
ncbi:CPBP family intramembrane glutamic endopeptidase [Kineothrix sp. MB12-C1]|uniref:CPBP family intramembrane glutamic endopeptidase n=1 Tax=Kineothrix sp. MB12-C1 TaxID=3070215 RepID=UPI0027D262CA|nr:type II CAAX endopeptidase family protein [Kineothrix sp. MB12-C1]WMC91587.1 type II CAAX endopeptidase family protein [Kineothrix sp. MB12-C1]